MSFQCWNSFVSLSHMPTGSLDGLSHIDASSALVNCDPAFLTPGSPPAQVGFSTASPPWRSTTWWGNLSGPWEGCLRLLSTIPLPLNLWTEIRYWIKHHEFSSDPTLSIFKQNWCHNAVLLLVTLRVNRNDLLRNQRAVFPGIRQECVLSSTSRRGLNS